jgi:hypothetical protein
VLVRGAAHNGHRNASGLFAIDALALSGTFGAMAKNGDAPDTLAGWGRPIVAPASGRIVVARGDRPDQPQIGTADPRFFVPEFSDGGDPGNHGVINHGNGEFSMNAGSNSAYSATPATALRRRSINCKLIQTGHRRTHCRTSIRTGRNADTTVAGCSTREVEA